MAGFERVLGFKVILLITIITIVGTGISFLPAVGAGMTGPASIIAWIILSAISIYTAMCFSEMASMFPKAGGIYEYTKKAYGAEIGFLTGWILWLINNLTIAMLIMIAIESIIPESLKHLIILKICISIAWTLIFSYISYKGIKTSSIMITSFSLIALSVFLLIIISGFFSFEIGNLDPFFIYEGINNIPLILLTMFFIFQFFSGIETVLFFSEETKNPSKVIPKALILGTTLVSLLSIILVLISLGVMNYSDFAHSSSPLQELAGILLGQVGKEIITLGFYLIIMGAAASWIISGSRLIASLSEDNMIPSRFAEFHKDYSSPYNAVKLQALSVILFIIIGFLIKGYQTKISILIILQIIITSIGLSALLMLRIKKPENERIFKVKFAFIIVPSIIALNIILIITWLMLESKSLYFLLICVSLIMIGLPIFYFLQLQLNPGRIKKISSYFSYFQLIFENMLIPKETKEKLTYLISPIKGKKILDYGCSVGTMSLHLIENNATVYGIESSKISVRIARERIKKRQLDNAVIIHDNLLNERIHPDIPQINGVISISTLYYIQDIDKIMSELNQRLETGDKICFLEYDKIYHILSTSSWLKNDALIRHIFRRNGFLVNIERKKGILWNTIIIYGKKFLESYKPEFREDDLKLIHSRLQPLKDLREYMKNKIEPFSAEIMDKRLSIVLQTDKELDHHKLSVNYHYFEEMVEFIYKIIIKYSLEKTTILIQLKDIGNKLRLDYFLKVDEYIESLFLDNNSYSEKHKKEFKEHKKNMIQLKEIEKMITIGYNGKFKITKSISNKNPLNNKKVHTLIKGAFDDEKFNISEEENIRIIIDIPLISLE